MSYALVLAVLVTLSFLLPRTLPERPLGTLSDPRPATFAGGASTRAALERCCGLDRPLLERYGSYLAGRARRPPAAAGSRSAWKPALVIGVAARGLVAARSFGYLRGATEGWAHRRWPAGRQIRRFPPPC